MRPFYLLLSLFWILALTACGSEEEITPPVFSNIAASGSLGSITPLTAPSQDPVITITGNIDDVAATIVANTVSGETSVTVQNDGTWEFDLTPKEGTNIVTFTASDQRGNINQLVLTVHHDTTAPLVKTAKQIVDPSPQLVVTFNEALLEASLDTALFSIVNAADDTVIVDSLIATFTTPKTGTLLLGVTLLPGTYKLTCPGVKDIATPDGNSIAVGYSFNFTIQ